ncbi:hypothetical protein AHAS_Ahas14G0257800 [Arachis hypogaea]
MATDLGMRGLEVEVDSVEIVDIINNCIHNDEHYTEAVIEVAKLRRSPWELVFKHINRKANRLADWLAKEAIRKKCAFRFLDSLPKELTSMYFDDLQGKAMTNVNVPATPF